MNKPHLDSGILRDQIASMEKEVDQLAHNSKERAQLLIAIDRRKRQIDNIKLIARGMVGRRDAEILLPLICPFM